MIINKCLIILRLNWYTLTVNCCFLFLCPYSIDYLNLLDLGDTLNSYRRVFRTLCQVTKMEDFVQKIRGLLSRKKLFYMFDRKLNRLLF